MLKAITRESFDPTEMTTPEMGWEMDVTQLEQATRESSLKLIKTDQLCLASMALNAKLNQRVVGKPGYVNFGLPAINTTPIWVGDQFIGPDKLVLFPDVEQTTSVSRTGFRATAIHLQRAQLENLLHVLFQRTLGDLFAQTGANQLPAPDQTTLREELARWSYLARDVHAPTNRLLRQREEALAQVILSGLFRCRDEVNPKPLKSERAMRSALEFIHHQSLDEMTVTRLCGVAGCSISALEYSFNRRFGVTPKRYMRGLQLSRVRNDLLRFDEGEYEFITDLANVHGFWHMGQFAADYCRLFGELPSKTAARTCS